MNKLLQGKCENELKKLKSNSVDAIVTDPPYGWSFMGKKWDYQIPSVEVFKEMLRVLKPGGHILCACGTNTQHRTCNIEDAGFEIRNIVSDFFSSHDAFGALWDSFTDEQKKLYGYSF
jgi:DNA modification methylase